MTRLRFILVSFFAAVAACLGYDRERLARAWLARNGFVIAEYETHCIGSPELSRHRVVINHSKLGVAGARMRSSSTPPKCVATEYLDWLARNDFTITEFHEQAEFVSDGSADWNNVTFKTTELAPPTLHRFERPWWI